MEAPLDLQQLGWDLIIVFPILLFSVSFHESAHGLAALWCGDSTAKRAGRVTLDPFAHLDPWGSIVLPLVLIVSHLPVLASAKPTPVAVGNLRKPKRDFSIVAFAGPLSNFLLAAVFALLAWMLVAGFEISTPSLRIVLKECIGINLLLGFFNLIPLPALDGIKCLYFLLPDSWCWALSRVERYGLVVVYLAFYLGLISFVAVPLQACESALFKFARL